MSSQLVWQLINKHNSFKVKNRTGKRTILSAEPGNLYNKHSYKHSGLANEKTIDIQPGSKEDVVITVSRSKNASKPASSKHTYTTKKHSRRAGSSIGKEARRIRPDLKRDATARVGAIRRAQKKHNVTARSS